MGTNGHTAAASLRVSGLSKRYGEVVAVDDVDFHVDAGSLTCLIGPNGAGKSTLLHCLAGIEADHEGSIELGDLAISRWPAHRRATAGLSTVLQTTRPLPDLDVLTNVMLGCHAWTRSGFLAAAARLPSWRRDESAAREAAWDALELVGLAARAGELARGLPIGELRLLAIARALAARPGLLLLDEPVAGLRGDAKGKLAEVFRGLRDVGVTQILVEHDMQFVGAVAERVLVLDRGRLIADGAPEEIRADQRVVAAYLGTEESELVSNPPTTR
jgi:branched-chain amino acid transport system ATP-binding protein